MPSESWGCTVKYTGYASPAESPLERCRRSAEELLLEDPVFAYFMQLCYTLDSKYHVRPPILDLIISSLPAEPDGPRTHTVLQEIRHVQWERDYGVDVRRILYIVDTFNSAGTLRDVSFCSEDERIIQQLLARDSRLYADHIRPRISDPASIPLALRFAVAAIDWVMKTAEP
jgi:hypothetical protein